MPPTKEQLTHGTRITCEIDGVKIEDARINIDKLGIFIFYHGATSVFARAIFDEDITSDKYKIRLVEEKKEIPEHIRRLCGGGAGSSGDTEVITLTDEYFGKIVNGNLLSPISHLYMSKKVADNYVGETVALSISYSLPKPETISL